jgi:hypothetical protein
MKKNKYSLLALFAVLTLSIISCQNFEVPEMVLTSEDDPSLNGPLQRFWAFENVATDSIWGSRGTATGVTFADGVKGKAYKGSTTGQIEYSSAGKLATLESFTVAFWMKTDKHKGGAQSLFMLPNSGDFWGNMFMTIEGNEDDKNNTMLAKFNFGGNWIVFDQTNNANGLNRWSDAYGKWKHVVFSYDGATSKFAAYVDGAKLPLASSVTDRTKEIKPKEFVPLGPLKMANVSKFVLGGFQQHIGIKAPADDWMLHYTGMLDQFRVYTRALSDTEITELYTKKM